MMRGTHIIVHNHPLAQVTSTQGHHIQQNVFRIEDKDHDDYAKYLFLRLIYNRSRTRCGRFQFQRVGDANVQDYMLQRANHNETWGEVYIQEVI